MSLIHPAPPLPSLSIDSHNLVATMRESYFSFEALTEHPFDFQSYLYGHFPEILSIDGCAKVISDDVSPANLEQCREERVMDMDLCHQHLKYSMMSKMVFPRRLRWTVEALPAFGSRNRISNLMLRTARGKPPAKGSPELGDAGQLMIAIGEGSVDDLIHKHVDDLKNIYRLCFPGGGISRCVSYRLL